MLKQYLHERLLKSLHQKKTGPLIGCCSQVANCLLLRQNQHFSQRCERCRHSSLGCIWLHGKQRKTSYKLQQTTEHIFFGPLFESGFHILTIFLAHPILVFSPNFASKTHGLKKVCHEASSNVSYEAGEEVSQAGTTPFGLLDINLVLLKVIFLFWALLRFLLGIIFYFFEAS